MWTFLHFRCLSLNDYIVDLHVQMGHSCNTTEQFESYWMVHRYHSHMFPKERASITWSFIAFTQNSQLAMGTNLKKMQFGSEFRAAPKVNPKLKWANPLPHQASLASSVPSISWLMLIVAGRKGGHPGNTACFTSKQGGVKLTSEVAGSHLNITMGGCAH